MRLCSNLRSWVTISTFDSSPIPVTGRLAGIDYGSVRIGISICDPSQRWVSPLTIYTRRNKELDFAYFQELANREGIVGWILGLPLHCSGEESKKSEEARAFGESLQESTGVQVEFYDERFSSRMAHQRLEQGSFSAAARKKRLDSVAAQIILEGYLESNRSEANSGRTTFLEDS